MALVCDSGGAFCCFVAVRSSICMNLNRRCPPPIHSRPSRVQREQAGCAVSHCLWLSVYICRLKLNAYGPFSFAFDMHRIRVPRAHLASCCCSFIEKTTCINQTRHVQLLHGGASAAAEAKSSDRGVGFVGTSRYWLANGIPRQIAPHDHG
jgi:hypothetical protein